MKMDLGPIKEGSSPIEIPPGTYLCQIGEVRFGQSQEGHEQWGIKLVIVDDPNKGRVAAWDNLTWSPRGVSRVKRILRLLGFPVDGVINIEHRELEGKLIQAQVERHDYTDPTTGESKSRNRVPFDGYEEHNGKGEEGESIPF